MSVVKGWNGRSPSQWAQASETAGRLIPQELFHRILERKHARVESTGRGFCVVKFKLCDDNYSGFVPERLKDILRDKLRVANDEIGWFDERHAGVFLSDTSATEALKCAGSVGTALADEFAPGFRIHTYPVLRKAIDAASRNTPPHCRQLSVPAEDFGPVRIAATPAWKRTTLMMGAIIGLILLSPLMLVIALAIRLSSRGPAIFKQQRAGLKGQAFTCYNFRSMVADGEAQKKDLMPYNEHAEVAFKMADDPRVTRLGRFLRKTSLDELPHLYNVLRGDMSVV